MSGPPVDEPAPIPSELHRSSRDAGELAVRLTKWLTERMPAGADPRIDGLHATSANGMSSETILFVATWTEGGNPRTEDLVARIAPNNADVPVFPSYDLTKQYDVIKRVGELTGVPVPPVRWSEPDDGPIGSPFFVMGRLDGRVPPDILPYNFGDSWLYDASLDEQRHLQDATVQVLADLHSIENPEREFAYLEFDERGDTPLRRHVAHTRAWYEFAAADGGPSPLVERGFDWLDEHWPSDEGPTVLSWGDSRIGNVMYDGFDPIGVFDWEMCGLGPRELDLAWLAYAHCAFQDIAANYGVDGMPHFLRMDDVAATYEKATGHTPKNLEWFGTYAAVQWGIVGLRTGRRSVHFGERPAPDDIDELLLNRQPLERMLAGEYWS